jgi:hypothetical protein
VGVRGARIVLGGLVLMAACARMPGGHHPPTAEQARLRAELETMLARAAANWNRGNLDAFVGRDSVTARGPTSLLVRRVQGRWRIAHDHSS